MYKVEAPKNQKPNTKYNRYIEAVSVCVNYSDFLIHTLPNWTKIFDKIVIVTDLFDFKTVEVCKENNVECIQTNVFYENGDKINKGKGINEGLKKLDLNGWVVHIDADIFLPILANRILHHVALDTQNIYGIDRMMCTSYKSWMEFLDNKKYEELLHSNYCFVHGNAFPMGTRLGEFYNTGYTPIGFFQMWHPIGSGNYSYPDQHGAVDRTDVQQAKKFIRINRQLIPELIAIHLESEYNNVMGKNWEGRSSAIFKDGVNISTDNENNDVWLKIYEFLSKMFLMVFEYIKGIKNINKF